MELVIRHQTVYRYATSASRVALLLRLQPAMLDGQKLQQWQVTVNDIPVRNFSPNAFGDGEAFFQLRSSISKIQIVASGVVETKDRQGVISGFRRDVPPKVFLRQTALTRPDDAIIALAHSLDANDDISRLHTLSARVRERIDYRSGSTSAGSTAAEALALGKGVCQDHAHVFVSAARALGIPARYVVGYLLADDDGQALHETHGWAEAWIEGLGWVGFDSTNGVCVTEHYIRLCCGMDAHDAAPIRGSVLGTMGISIDADVLINEAVPDVPPQSQQQ